MSFKVVEWVLDHSESEGSVRLVMLALAENADQDTGECYPSLATVARSVEPAPRSAPRRKPGNSASSYAPGSDPTAVIGRTSTRSRATSPREGTIRPLTSRSQGTLAVE